MCSAAPYFMSVLECEREAFNCLREITVFFLEQGIYSGKGREPLFTSCKNRQFIFGGHHISILSSTLVQTSVEDDSAGW